MLNSAAMGKPTRRARAKADYLGFLGALPAAAGGVPLSEALPRWLREGGSRPLLPALRAAAAGQAARV